MSAFCQACGTELDYKPGDLVGRGDECPKCRVDLHACVHCVHYDPRAYNQCHEPQAERVDDRLKANFCEYFKIRSAPPGRGASGSNAPGAATAGPTDRTAAARARLDSLFKKKPEA